MEKQFQPTPLQKIVAEQLARCKTIKQISREYPISDKSVQNWNKIEGFRELVEEARLAYVKQLKSAGFDLESYLKQTMQESLNARASRNDGLKAAHIWAQIQGLYLDSKSKKQEEKEQMEAAKKMSDEELETIMAQEELLVKQDVNEK